MASTVKKFSLSVADFSSQYGSEQSASYTVPNIAGEPSVYPNYGDFTQACVLRTYGPWWKEAPSGREDFKRTPSSFISDDFIELHIEPVFLTGLEIYETYHPGALVKILAKGTTSWFTLWECSQRDLKRLPHEVRIFTPEIRKCPFPTKLLRLEFNSRHLDYYTELDAVNVIGIPYNDMSEKKAACDHVSSTGELLSKLQISPPAGDGQDYFQFLPQEVIQLILSYLDLQSLCRLSRTCHLLYKHCCDPLQYTELNLQPYWDKANNSTLEVLSQKCYQLVRLNLSWCGKYGLINNATFQVLLVNCGAQLVTLSLACCPFVDDDVMQTIVLGCPSLEELDLQSCREVSNKGFLTVSRVKHLKYLNLYRTFVDMETIISIIMSCNKLEHLNLGSCQYIKNFDSVALALARNSPQLKSLDVWRAHSLTETGLLELAGGCPGLEELELGWCSHLRLISSNKTFIQIFKSCPKLKKLFLTANKVFSSEGLMGVAHFLPDMEQIDILGCPDVGPEAVQCVLEKCKKLKFFDLSFCAKLDHVAVRHWRQMFPLVDIKKSFQTYIQA